MLEEEQVAENHRKGLPHNFSWLKPSRIAGTSAPRRMSEVDALVREGVSHLVSLSPEVALPTSSVDGLTIHHIPVTEHKAPTLEQIQDFIEICEKATNNLYEFECCCLKCLRCHVLRLKAF